MSEKHALAHRNPGYALLRGHGLEIGAFNEPAKLPSGCTVEYADVLQPAELLALFPELHGKLAVDELAPLSHVVNLDHEGLASFAPASFDFVVLNHVIEHVANPIRVIGELFRVTRPAGYVVISAPDMRFTPDHGRALTSYEHVLDEFRGNVSEVTDEHYLDLMRSIHPYALATPEATQSMLDYLRRRHEHAHVWDSSAFEAFLAQTFALLDIDAANTYVSLGQDNRIEYFSVWQKSPPAGVARHATPARASLWQRAKRVLNGFRRAPLATSQATG